MAPPQHGVWKTLFERQAKVLPGRACAEFLDGLAKLKLVSDQIPDLERLSDGLEKLTGWRVVAVPSLVPDEVFFDHLANRRFPAGQFIRRRTSSTTSRSPTSSTTSSAMCRCWPIRSSPTTCRPMARGGVRALTQFHALKNLARLYWYTVEFGLIETPRACASTAPASSPAAPSRSTPSGSPSPNRIGFDLERVMRTEYRIDDFQESYFVIRSFDELFAETYKDFAALYAKLQHGPAYKPGDILAADHLHHRGTHTYVGGSHAANVDRRTPLSRLLHVAAQRRHLHSDHRRRLRRGCVLKSLFFGRWPKKLPPPISIAKGLRRRSRQHAGLIWSGLLGGFRKMQRVERLFEVAAVRRQNDVTARQPHAQRLVPFSV